MFGNINARAVAAHFEEATLGRALTEAGTWLDSETINNRFRRLLADPFEDGGNFYFFPNVKKDPDFWRRGTMDILWQLRRSITHNVGVITRSDAAKLRLLRRGYVNAPKVLSLTNGDVWYAKLFLDELATWGNDRVATRLARLLDRPPQRRSDALRARRARGGAREGHEGHGDDRRSNGVTVGFTAAVVGARGRIRAVTGAAGDPLRCRGCGAGRASVGSAARWRGTLEP